MVLNHIILKHQVQSDVSTFKCGPVTVSTSSTTTSSGETTSTTGDTAQYATSTQGLTYLSKAGFLINVQKHQQHVKQKS